MDNKRCGICDKEFSNDVEYSKHIVSDEHITKHNDARDLLLDVKTRDTIRRMHKGMFKLDEIEQDIFKCADDILRKIEKEG